MSGDPELTGQLAAAGGRRPGDVAAVAVDLHTEPGAWFGYLGEADGTRRFELGSISKALTGMLLADAITRGELTLDTAAAALAPELEGTALGAVTMRQLASHTSGLPRLPMTAGSAGRAARLAYLGRDPYRGLKAARVLHDAARQKLKAPGQRLYSNFGGAVCGQLLVRAAGAEGYAQLLQARIVEPVGLTDTFVAERGRTAPPGRSPYGGKRQPWVMDGYAPAGGVVSTIADLARLAHGLLSGTAPGCASLEPIDDGPEGERRSGMFWVIEPGPVAGQHVVWHNGGTGGYSAFFALAPQHGRALAVLAAVGREGAAEQLAAGLMPALTAS